MLPGGEIERGESPRHAAQEETEEETGILIDEAGLRLVAIFTQKPRGLVMLYDTDRFNGEVISHPTVEILEARFMSLKDIRRRNDEFGLGYGRMIMRWLRCINGIDPIPFEGRLSDKVEYLKNPLIHIADSEFARYLLRFGRYTDLFAQEFKERKLGKDVFTSAQYLLGFPAWWFLKTYIRHKGFMDSWQGFVFSFFSALRFPISFVKYIRYDKKN